MLCKNCSKETGKKSSYCNDTCKMAYHRNKPVTESVTVTESPVTETVTQTVISTLPANFGLPDCDCWHCKQNRSKPDKEQYIINHGPNKTASELLPKEINRQSLPGDVDYKAA
jgi:hypothetical protein